MGAYPVYLLREGVWYWYELPRRQRFSCWKARCRFSPPLRLGR